MTVFWIAVLCASSSVVLYCFIIYPLLVYAAAAVFGRRGAHSLPLPEGVSVVTAMREGDHTIRRRVAEMSEILRASGVPAELIVVVDRAEILSAAGSISDQGNPAVKILHSGGSMGKAAALNLGVEHARYELLVFADSRQRWEPETIPCLLSAFRDPNVGAVSGDLQIESSPSSHGMGLYWRHEKWIRKNESTFDSVVGVSGAVCAVRRGLFHPVPSGTILDDVYWPLLVIMQGYRVIHEERARVFDRFPDKTRDEFRRKVRTLCGNYQLISRLPAALLPWKNRTWWQYVSRKLGRLAAPWALIFMLISSGLIDHALCRTFFGLQIAGYGVVVVSLVCGWSAKSRLLSAAASFVVLNAAAWVAFWVWVNGNAGGIWHTSSYGSLSKEAKTS